jgi:hypothetical protein
VTLQSIRQTFKTVVVLAVIPNPLPVVHESCRPMRTPVELFAVTPSAVVSLITGTPSNDSISTIQNVQLAIKDTNLPNINISHLENYCTKIPHSLTLSATNLKSFIKNSCFDFRACVWNSLFLDDVGE